MAGSLRSVPARCIEEAHDSSCWGPTPEQCQSWRTTSGRAPLSLGTGKGRALSRANKRGGRRPASSKGPGAQTEVAVASVDHSTNFQTALQSHVVAGLGVDALADRGGRARDAYRLLPAGNWWGMKGRRGLIRRRGRRSLATHTDLTSGHRRLHLLLASTRPEEHDSRVEALRGKCVASLCGVKVSELVPLTAQGQAERNGPCAATLLGEAGSQWHRWRQRWRHQWGGRHRWRGRRRRR